MKERNNNVHETIGGQWVSKEEIWGHNFHDNGENWELYSEHY